MLGCAIAIAIAMGQGAPPQSVELYRWFDGLSYRQYLDKPFVLVEAHATDPDAKTYIEDCGFLISEDSIRFTVLQLNLGVHTFQRSDPSVSSIASWSHRPAEFREFVKSRLHKEKNPNQAPPSNPSPYDQIWFIGYGTDYSLAWLCHSKGMETEANEFLRLGFEPRYRDDSSRRELTAREAEDYVAGDIYNGLVHGFENRHKTYADLLADFRPFSVTFIDTSAGNDAKEACRLLEEMVAENQAHREVSDSDLAKLPVRERVGELIWRLRDSDPFYQYTGGSPEEQLRSIGLPAVPQLLDALHNERFTRILFFHDSGPPTLYTSRLVYRVRDRVAWLLRDISGKDFWGPNWTEPAAIESSAKKWWASIQADGESRVLIAGVQVGDGNSGSQAWLLVQKFPRVAFEPMVQGIRNAKEPRLRAEIIRAFQSLNDPRVARLARKLVAETKDLPARFAAEKLLAKFDPEAAIAAVGREWRKLEHKDEFGLEGDDLASFLTESQSLSALAILSKNFARHHPRIRGHVIFEFMRGCHAPWPLHFPQAKWGEPNPPASKEWVIGVEDFLASALHDRGVCETGSYSAAESISTHFLCDAAYHALSHCFPTKYKIEKGDSAPLRERNRLLCLRIYRASRSHKQTNRQKVRPPLTKRAEKA